MARLMSVTLSEQAVDERTKTVTRRLGWTFLKPGDHLTLCRKVQGRRKGEPLVRLAHVKVLSVTREPLNRITVDDCAREGFEYLTPAQFVEFFCTTHKHCLPDTTVTRIEWRYIE